MRGLRRPIILFACGFALASGTAAFAYTTASGSGSGQAQAVTLNTPGAGSAAKPTTTSLSLSWGASSGLPPGGGYLVLRSTSSGGPYAKVSSGTCNQVITLVSAGTSCTDTGLTVGTTYYYEVEAGYYDVATLWVSAPDAQFSGTTALAASGPGTTSRPPGDPGRTGQAPADHKRQLDELLRRHRGQLPGDGVGQPGAHVLEHGVQWLQSVRFAPGRDVLQHWPPVGHPWRQHSWYLHRVRQCRERHESECHPEVHTHD